MLAGPGTGKTTTLVETAVARVDAGVPVDDILMLTFSRKAAGELRDRVTARLARTVREPVARTMHSYAFGLLRIAAVRSAERGETVKTAPRLLGGAEQDVVVRQLLEGGRAADWPTALHPALTTDGFASELRDLIMRAKERGYDGPSLQALGSARGRPDWVAAGRFLEEYEEVNALDPAKGFDQAALIRAAINALEADPQLLAAERARRRRIYVDEYQDTDPAQVQLLQLLAEGADELILVGDPDQSIYAFRGADEAAIAHVDDHFGRTGRIPVLALTTCRRSGPVLLAATRRVAAKLPGRGEQRALVPLAGIDPGRVEVRVFRSSSEEAAYVANELRRAGLGTGEVPALPWSRMAILVRTTGAVGTLRRALVTAGVPIAVRREELALAEQPVVAMLLDVLAYAIGRPMTDELAEGLLTGPIGGGDSLLLRRLARAVRQVQGLEPTARVSLAPVVTDVLGAAVLPERVRRPVLAVARTLHAARAAAADGGNAETVLWAAWSASGLGPVWERGSLRADAVGAAANRDLDAALQLFAEAAAFVDRLPYETPAGFEQHLRAQQIPGGPLSRGGGVSEGVEILTAHASKGLEWDFVVVAGAQEGIWPDLRRRGTLLGTEQLVDAADGVVGPDPASSAKQLAEERRLFYVAATRARHRLLATAVSGEEEQPSRFLDELMPTENERPLTRLPRAAHRSGVVAHLRTVVCDPAQPADARAEAAGLLAELAAAGVPGADPDDWWGLAPPSTEEPVRVGEELVRVGPSRIESFIDCELKALMELLGVRDGDFKAAELGTLIHSIAQSADGRSIEELQAELDERIGDLDFGAPWMAANERERAHGMLDVFVEWLEGSRGEFEQVGTELSFTVEVGGAVLSGRVDRLEKDAAGRLVVVDLKTGKNKPANAKIPTMPQLGAYQLAVEHGAFAGHGSESGGAMLVQVGASGKPEQRQAPLAEAEDPDWARAQVEHVVRVVRGSTFTARHNERCRVCDVRTTCPLQDEGGQVTG